MVPLDDTDIWGDDPFAMLMLTVVVQLNCTRPCTPLLLIRTPPVVRIVETESPPGPPPSPANDSSMLVSRYGSPLIVTVWFVQSRNSIRDVERKRLPCCCGTGFMVMTMEPPPAQGEVKVFGLFAVVLPTKAIWLIA